MRSHEERRRLFEEPTQSRISPNILQYTKIGLGVKGLGKGSGIRGDGFEVQKGVGSRASQFQNNDFTEMCSGSEVGSYFRLIELCTTQL